MNHINNQSFAEKYRAKKYTELVNQEAAVEEARKFLLEFPKKKALLIHGPPGTGKTTLALLAAKENNLEIFELNASDLRNRAKLEDTLRPATIQKSLFKKGKVILMDEVDGVTGSDIGGIPELVRIIEITRFPIILTCNDVWQSKLSDLRQKCKLIEMKSLSKEVIIKVLDNIAKNENMVVSPEFLGKLAIKSQGDVRAALNDMQAYASGDNTYVDQESKRDLEDNIFNILRKIFKERNDFLGLFDNTSLSLDEIFLWIEENIPKEYKNETLAKAYYALGQADVFRGRIYKDQSWRFLIYQNIFQSAGISYAKLAATPGFTKYERPKRVLKIWMNNQRTVQKKSIARKYAELVHCSVKRAMRDFELIRPVIKQENVQKQLKLSEEEIAFINK